MGGYKYRVFLRKRPGLQNGVRLQGVSVRRGSTVIANLSFGVFLRRAGILAKQASPPNRVSPAHVITRLRGLHLKI